jgi:hypothetical protein
MSALVSRPSLILAHVSCSRRPPWPEGSRNQPLLSNIARLQNVKRVASPARQCWSRSGFPDQGLTGLVVDRPGPSRLGVLRRMSFVLERSCQSCRVT